MGVLVKCPTTQFQVTLGKMSSVFFLLNIFSQMFLCDTMLGPSANYFCGQKNDLMGGDKTNKEKDQYDVIRIIFFS